jgi:hypothetical protein
MRASAIVGTLTLALGLVLSSKFGTPLVQITSNSGVPVFVLSHSDMSSPFQVLAKVERFCSGHHRDMIALLTASRNHPCCFGLFLAQPPRNGDQSALDGYSMLHFLYQNAVRIGMSRSIFFPSAPHIISPSQVFTWRTSLALLLPLPCDDPSDRSFSEDLFRSLRSLKDDETRYWLDLHLIVGIDSSCSHNSTAIGASLSEHGLVSLQLVEFPHQSLLITQKLDYLSLVAYGFGCKFFLTLHPNTLFSERHVLWRGISTLIEPQILPDFEGFGFVLFPTTRDSLLSCSPTDVSRVECQSPVALFGRSHVELFVIPAIGGDTSNYSRLLSPSLSPSWTSLEQSGFNLLACMSFYCKVYHGLRESCATIFDYITTAMAHPLAPSPASSSRISPSSAISVLLNEPRMVTRLQMDAVSWLSTASAYVFRDPLQFLAPSPDPSARIAFISAIYGAYESSLKPFVRQSIASDFICFTDLPETVPSNGWIVDRTPYHETIQLPYDSPDSVNSLSRNRHPMNVGKFYKTAFPFIPRLQHYDLVVWIDGNVVVTNSSVGQALLRLADSGEPLVIFEHTRNGSLAEEVSASASYHKYQSTNFAGFPQPRQDVVSQYAAYLQQGYDQELWRRLQPSRPQYGLWCTCFIGFDMRDERVSKLLSLWHEHILRYTTQDQISFSFVTQSLGLFPHSLPDDDVEGTPQLMNSWFYKTPHAG